MSLGQRWGSYASERGATDDGSSSGAAYAQLIAVRDLGYDIFPKRFSGSARDYPCLRVEDAVEQRGKKGGSTTLGVRHLGEERDLKVEQFLELDLLGK